MPQFATAEDLDEFITRPSHRVIDSIAAAPRDFIVLGAGGKMGYHVTRMLQRALTAAGRTDQVTAISRFTSNSTRKRLERLGVDAISADLTAPEEVARLPAAGNVIFLAGKKFGTGTNQQILDDYNIRMPQLVAERFHQARIVALSTGNVYPYVHYNSGGATEECPTVPAGSYGRSCLGREQAFIDASRRHSTPCAILRLNYSVALRYGIPTDLACKVREGLPVDVDMGYVNMIWQGDAVTHILLSFALTASPPCILNITGAETVRIRDLANALASRFRVTAKICGKESETALLSNASRSHQLLGAPQIRLNQIIDWTAEWVENGGELLNKPTHFESRAGIF